MRMWLVITGTDVNGGLDRGRRNVVGLLVVWRCCLEVIWTNDVTSRCFLLCR